MQLASTRGCDCADGIGVISLLLCVVLQDPVPVPARAPKADPIGVTIDERGWPVLPDEPRRPLAPPASPVGETAPRIVETEAAQPVEQGVRPADTASALPQIFTAVRSPSAFRSLGGITIWWRLSVHGPLGETIGVREFTQLADASVVDRDRLTFADGRVIGRLGTSIFAQRHGMQRLSLAEQSADELGLFGLQARLPWAFADGQKFVETASDLVSLSGEELLRVRLQAKSHGDAIGPSPEGAPPVDTFELWVAAAGGPPREFVHTLARSGQRRRVLLEDWREVAGVLVPFRRVYVDQLGRPATTLEVLRFEPGAATADRDFRLQ